MSSRTRPVRFTLSMKGSISVICSPKPFRRGRRRRSPSPPGRFEASVIRPDKTRPKPTPREISHLYKRTAHRDARPLRHWKVLNDTINFRKDRERFFRLPCLFNLRDLFVSDVPELSRRSLIRSDAGNLRAPSACSSPCRRANAANRSIRAVWLATQGCKASSAPDFF
jgi:hypothetical protein